jgi:hypothetical protein
VLNVVEEAHPQQQLVVESVQVTPDTKATRNLTLRETRLVQEKKKKVSKFFLEKKPRGEPDVMTSSVKNSSKNR